MSKYFTKTAYTCLLLSSLSFSAFAETKHNHPSEAPTVSAKPELKVSEPVPNLLAKGLVVLPFQVNNMKIMPVYGESALDVTPALGHLHIGVNGAGWHWVHSSNEPIVLQGLPSGKHQVSLELANANHQVLTSQIIDFTVPAK